MATKTPSGEWLFSGDQNEYPGLQFVAHGWDLVTLNPVHATVFGYQDTGDNGISCCGVNTNNAALVAVSLPLPMSVGHHGCDGTPLHEMKFGHVENGKPVGEGWVVVQVYNCDTGKIVRGPCVEIGPSNKTHGGHGMIDLTWGMYKALGGPSDNPNSASARVAYRIIGAVRFLDEQFWPPRA